MPVTDPSRSVDKSNVVAQWVCRAACLPLKISSAELATCSPQGPPVLGTIRSFKEKDMRKSRSTEVQHRGRAISGIEGSRAKEYVPELLELTETVGTCGLIKVLLVSNQMLQQKT
jgi:hypothetical protein